MDFEGIYCFDTATVRVAVYPDGPQGPRIVAQVSEDTLHDALGVVEIGERMLEACKRHFDVVEAAAVERYRASPRQSITLGFDDLRAMAARRGAFAHALAA